MNTLQQYKAQIETVTSALESGDDAAFSLERAKLDCLLELQRDIVRMALAGDADHKTLLIQTLKVCRVTKQNGTIEELAARWRVDSAELMRVLIEHFASAARDWHSAAQPYLLPSHEMALDSFIKSGRSGFIRASLGSGKTEKIAGRLVSLCKKIGTPVVAATVLKSLTRQLSKAFGLPLHRDDAREIEDAKGCVTTIHGLDSRKLDGLFSSMRQLGGFVIIDEPSSVGELLFSQKNNILTHEAKTRIVYKLKHLAQNGVRFLLLDGDITPCALQLAKLVGADALMLESTEQQHAQPPAVIWPQTFVTDTTTGERTKTRPRLQKIIELLQSGERVAIGCTSARHAKQLHKILQSHCSGKSILIYGQNTDEPEQAEFLADANGSAQKYQLVVYSPSLSQGFSVTAIEAHVFVFSTCNTLNPAALWQLARRFRRAVGAVNFVCNTSQQRDQTHVIPNLAEVEQDYQTLIAQHGGNYSDLMKQGNVVADYQNALAKRNPTNALAGHLFNLGVCVDFKFCCNTGNAQEAQAAKEVAKADIQRIATAPHTDPLQARELARAAKATEKQQAQVRRAEIEANLLLTAADHEPDGTLPLEIVARCENEQLENKVRRLALVQSGVQFDSNQRNNYQGAQVEIMRDILAEMTNEDGQIVYSQRAAERIADQFRSQIRIAYSQIPQAPRRTRGKPPKVYGAQVSQWLTGLLSSWGFHRRKIGTEKTNRLYNVTPCKAVAFYAQRWVEIHMHANGLKPLRQ